MSHQDTDRHTPKAPHHQALKQALAWLLKSATLSNVSFREECTWSPHALIFTAILWVWSDEKSLMDRFSHARKIVMAMAMLRKPPATTYQAFIKMLKTWTGTLTIALIDAFRRRMQTDLANRFKIEGYCVFGVDGSRLELPRTRSNEQRFSPASVRKKLKSKASRKRRRAARTRAARDRRAREQKINSPQMWLTTMFHLGTGLPWDWRIGPSDSSEREHLRQMIPSLPDDSLVTADAGFVGYEYWKALLESGRHLLVRVGANVRLLKNLGYIKERSGVVYLWPDREAARKQKPLVLRLVVAQGGRNPVYLVTSVLKQNQLSDEQVVRIYALRWGIELFYRHFKQTFGRRKLRSFKGEHAQLEAIWSLLGLWAMCLHTQVKLAREEVPAHRISVAKMLRAYRRALREYKSPPDCGESLRELLSRAVIDPYKRVNKTSREYPRKKQHHAIGAPKIRCATKDQINMARQIRDHFALGLTA